MEFVDIKFEDRDELEPCLLRYSRGNCNFSFANLVNWQISFPCKVCRTGGFTVIKYSDDQCGVVYSVPFGEGDWSGILPSIEKDAADGGYPLHFVTTSEDEMNKLRKYYPNIGFSYLRSQSDYIYLKSDLATLHGGHLQAKRNMVHRFRSHYSYVYSELKESDFDDCRALLDKWDREHIEDTSVPDSYHEEVRDERDSIENAFSNFNKLGMIGGVLRVDGKLVAFCYGSAEGDDMFDTQVEKADETYDGSYAAINYEFANHLPDRFTYIDREEDMGIKGLRTVKEKYHPAILQNKYISSEMTPLALQLRTLWLRCFTMDNTLDAEQFLLTRFNTDNMLSVTIDGRIVSMLHIIPFGQAAYIYAVATDPDYRHRGIAGGLLKDALELCLKRGFSEAVLIPEGEKAAAWYETFGFKGRYSIRFNTSDEFNFFEICDDYDYGTGDPERDFAMVCPLTENSPVHDSDETLMLSDNG